MSDDKVLRWGFAAEINPLGGYVTYHDYMMVKEENDTLCAQLSAAHARVVELERGQHWLADMPFFREQIANAKVRTPYGEGLPAPWSFLSTACDCVDALANRLAEIERQEPACRVLGEPVWSGVDWRAQVCGLEKFRSNQKLYSAKAPVSPAAQAAQWVEWPAGVTEVRYLTDDRDLPEDEQHELVIRISRNHDWYVSVLEKGHRFGPAVRLCTSGGASSHAPGLCPAIAEAFRAIAAAQQQKAGGAE